MKWPWMIYNANKSGMLCTVWPKATDLLKKHNNSEWHMAALETQLMADLAQQSGDVVDMIVAVSEEEKTRNRKLLKALIRSLYYLIKHRIAHTTNFEDLISLQADNGNELLRLHLDTCPSNATYLSKATTADLLKSISHQFENDLR